MTDKKDSSGNRWQRHVWQPHSYNNRERLTTGTFLQSFCPHCDAELTHDDKLSLAIQNTAGEIGILDLSPYLNNFSRETNIDLHEGQKMKDVICPHCQKSLIIKDKTCENGDSQVAGFIVGVCDTRASFFICTKIGCHWHAMSAEDSSRIRLEDSDEW